MDIDADGWTAGARRVPSSNYSPRPDAGGVSLVVLHGISLPPGEFGGDEVLQLFTNALDCAAHPAYAGLRDLRVSAHFFIRRDGETLQFVSCCDSAWHAGDSCWRQQPACNDYSIGIELEGVDDVPYADAQYRRLASLLRAIIAKYPGVHVTSHADIAPQRKSDPGPGFDWERLFTDIGTCYDGRQTA